MYPNKSPRESLVVVHTTKFYEPMQTIPELYSRIAGEIRNRIQLGQKIYFLGDRKMDFEDLSSVPDCFQGFSNAVTIVGGERIEEYLNCKRILIEHNPDQTVVLVGIARLNCVENFASLLRGQGKSTRSEYPISDGYFYEAATEMAWSAEQFREIFNARLNVAIIEDLTEYPQK